MRYMILEQYGGMNLVILQSNAPWQLSCQLLTASAIMPRRDADAKSVRIQLPIRSLLVFLIEYVNTSLLESLESIEHVGVDGMMFGVASCEDM